MASPRGTSPRRGALGSRVLAERNQAAAAVGVWVESGLELWKHPGEQASHTERLLQEQQRRCELRLQLFQEDVRHRVAQHQRLRRQTTTAQVLSASKAEGSVPCDWPPQDREQRAACSVRQRLACPGPLPPPPPQLSDHSPERPVSERRCSRRSRILWPIDNSEELRRERQAQILTQRRLFLSKDRQMVKETEEQRQHFLKTASLKAEKERVRLEAESRLRQERVQAAALQRLQQREQQIYDKLRLEEVEGGGAEAGDRQRSHTPVSKTTRQVQALRAQVRELFSGSGSEPPPLCCCGSFWDSHPDTCANNCVFHHDTQAYVQALQTVLQSWALL
ncbi:unnamed protein product [Knipowitschia caucasica]